MTLGRRIEGADRDRVAEPAVGSELAALLADIEPFFYRCGLTYVDVGAHGGEVFREVARSGFRLDEAHLIEPSPRAFARLERTVAGLDLADRATCHRVALAGRSGRLRLREAGTMTRVLGPAEAAGAAVFEAEATTLDLLARSFRQPRISILKIDVEGYEAEVLAGAEGLLAAQAVDLIYIEAGMNPQGTQQAYYRSLEDRLRRHGYRLFRIYEQMHEWQQDSPLLRRVNLAFLSERFARENPQRLSRELFERRQEQAGLHARADALTAEVAALRRELEEVGRTRAARIAALAAEVAELQIDRNREILRFGELHRKFGQLHAYARGLERKYLELLGSETWRAGEPIRALLRAIRRRKPPKLFRPRLEEAPALSRELLPAAPEADIEALRRLEEKLWGGFSGPALADLTAIASTGRLERRALSEASWMLARWHAAHRDFDLAYERVVQMRTADPGKRLTMRCVLLEADCLLRLGSPEAARALVGEALDGRPDNPDLCLVMANTYLQAEGAPADPARDALRLGWINRIYVKAGLLPLCKHDPERPLALDNLATPSAPAVRVGVSAMPKVSVIVPVYGARETLPFALRGLLAQTWTNLEILVVDDASPDDTVAVAEAFAARDPRVRVLRQPANRGSYAARNAGLRVATGDFVTTHDADDWSHPQKIELQVRHCQAEGVAANNSSWIRSERNLAFRGLFRPWRGLVSKNVSSILMPRATIERLGGWVEVRAGADTDLMRRMEVLFGPQALRPILFPGPLSFSLHEERSLTRQSSTHVRTVYFGVRKEFHDAAAHWRAATPPEALAVDPLERPRPFPVPGVLLPDREEAAACDVLFVADLSMEGGAYESTLNYVQAAMAARLRVAVFHWRRYDLDIRKPLNPPIRDLAQAGRLRIIAPGEAVRAKTVVIGYPVILRHRIDLFPQVDFDELVVVVNQMAARLHGGGDPQYDPEAIRGTLREIFGTEGRWVPISGLVDRLMRADPRYPAPADAIWTPLIDAATWCAGPLRWRGGEGGPPVVGRHARDHYTKWPSTPEALRAAFCAGRPCQVELMGGVGRALEVIGAPPPNWTVHRFGAMPALAFLRRLDVFVHYPHEDYIEEFGRAPMEAMAAGVPVILPPVFAPTFGQAALYAEPSEVWPLVERLWRDEGAWTARAAAGRAFVLKTCSYATFPRRLGLAAAGSAQ